MFKKYIALSLLSSSCFAVNLTDVYGNWYSEGNMKEFNKLTDAQKEDKLNAGFKPIIPGALILDKGNKFQLSPLGFQPVNGTFTLQNDILTLYSTVNPPIPIIVKLKNNQLIFNFKDGTQQTFIKK